MPGIHTSIEFSPLTWSFGRPRPLAHSVRRPSDRRGAPATFEILIVTPSVPSRMGPSRCLSAPSRCPMPDGHDLDRHRGRSTTTPPPPESYSSTPLNVKRPTEALPSAVCVRAREETQPRSISMMAEKSRPPWPCLSNRSNSCAASAPSGVAAPAASAASCASFRSFSIRAAAKPGL